MAVALEVFPWGSRCHCHNVIFSRRHWLRQVEAEQGGTFYADRNTPRGVSIWADGSAVRDATRGKPFQGRFQVKQARSITGGNNATTTE